VAAFATEDRGAGGYNKVEVPAIAVDGYDDGFHGAWEEGGV